MSRAVDLRAFCDAGMQSVDDQGPERDQGAALQKFRSTNVARVIDDNVALQMPLANEW